MRFDVWWSSWLRAWHRVLMSGPYKRRKTESERRRERERRLRKRRSLSKSSKPRRRRSRTGYNRTLDALVRFCVVSLGIILLPIGLLDWGRKSIKAKRTAPCTKAAHTRGCAASKKQRSAPKNDTVAIYQANSTVKITVDKVACEEEKPPEKPTEDGRISAEIGKSDDTVTDENAPKTTPKNARDRYVKKRMIIADSPQSDKNAFGKLCKGAYLELEAVAEQGALSGTILLKHEGAVVGSVAKADNLALLTNLKLGRRIYAIVSDVYREADKTEIEYEAWFETSQTS